MGPAVVKEIDHINILSDAPAAVAEALAAALGLPTSSPLVGFPTFELEVLEAGNCTIEVQRFGGRRPKMATPTATALGAIVFEPFDLDDALTELSARGVAHTAALPFLGRATRMPAYDDYRYDPRAPNFRVAVVDGMLGDLQVVQRASTRLVAGDSRLNRRVSRIMGRVASNAMLGRWTAGLFAMPPQFVAVCEWGHDLDARRSADRRRFAAAQDTALGLIGVREVIVGASDLDEARHRWQTLLDPALPDGDDCWQLGDGPAIRLIPDGRDQLRALVFCVKSVTDACAYLADRALLGERNGGYVSIARDRVFGLDLRLVEQH